MRPEAGAGAGFEAGAFADGGDVLSQGNPPISTSTGGTVVQSMVEMSPRFGMSGQWWAKTRATGSLISENQIVCPPVACSTARSRPPYPENNDPILGGRDSA